MKESSSPRRSRILVIIGIVIILGALVALYYTTLAPSGSQGSNLSSLSSEVSSLDQVVTSQSSQIQSLQAQQSHSGSGATTTKTVTSTVSGSATTVTSTLSGVSTSEVTTTTTVRIVSVITTILTPGGSDSFVVSGNLVIPSGNGSGTLNISVSDTGFDAIRDIQVSVPTGSDPTSDLCTTACAVTMVYNGNNVSLSSPLIGENTAFGGIATNEGQAGFTYTISIVVTFLDNTVSSQSLSLTAET